MDNGMPGITPRARISITDDDLNDAPSAAAAPVPAAAYQAPPPPPAPGANLPAVKAPAPLGAFCHACGNRIDPRASICPQCGVATAHGSPGRDPSVAVAAMALNHKSSGAAVLLSLLFTGAGQWYCGHVARGFAFFFAAVISAILCLVIIGFLLLPIVYIWAAIDAASLANQHNYRALTQATGVGA
jgi:TM2 domain-containing membrane protein YozV